MIHKQDQMGASLIEFMLALSIGAMVVMLAIKLYADGSRLLNRNQQTASQIDTASVVYELGSGLKLAGLGMPINPAQPILIDGSPNPANIALKWMSQSTNTQSTPPYHSDQLTIHYRAPMDMWDCEGVMALGPRRVRLTDGQLAMVDGQVVVERYFISREEDGTMALRCDAARYITEAIHRDGTRDRRGVSAAVMSAIIDEAVTGRQGVSKPYQVKELGDDGVVLLTDVEGFWMRLLAGDDTSVKLMDLQTYRQTNTAPIIGVKLAILQKRSAGDYTDTPQPIKVMGETIPSVTTSSHRLWMRDVYFANAGID